MLSARLILVRHGQSTHNAQARLQGQADPPLSDAGRAEAELLRPALPAFEDDRVVTSDLQRAAQTAALLGYPGARREPRLREIDVGAWEGRSLSDFPPGPETAWRGGPLKAPDGESWAELQSRVGQAIDELVAAGGGGGGGLSRGGGGRAASRLPRRRRARRPLARPRGRPAARRRPGQRQRHDRPGAGPAAARGL